MDCIYHEQQEAALCAVHCLNSLLQGSYFSAVDLAELATNMDQEECRRMAEQGTDTTEYRNFIQSGSNNMDDSGMFSVQVVSAALQVWGLQLRPFTTAAPSFREDPTLGSAYICNMREHWFTIRRLGFQWFNLNSLLAFPELLSNTYLALFLAQLQNQGYCIYLVEGPLPPCTADTQIAAHPVTQAVKPLLLSELADQEPQQQQESGGDDSSSQEDADMAAAVAASLAEAGRREAGPSTAGEGRRLGGEEEEEESEEAQLERALQMSLTEQLAGVAGPSPNTSASERELEAAFTMLNLACGVLAQGLKVKSLPSKDPLHSINQSNKAVDQEMLDVSQEKHHLVVLEQSGPVLPSTTDSFNSQPNPETVHRLALKQPAPSIPSTKDSLNGQTNPETAAASSSDVPENTDGSVPDVGSPIPSPTSPVAAAASEGEVCAAEALVCMLHKRGEAAAPPTPPLPRRIARARRQKKSKGENKENEMSPQNELSKPVLCVAAGAGLAAASASASIPDEATLRQRRLQFFDKKNTAAPQEDHS